VSTTTSVDAGPSILAHDLVSERQADGTYRTHDQADRFSLISKGEPNISAPITAKASARTKAVIDTNSYRLVAQFLIDDPDLKDDEDARAHFTAELIDTLREGKLFPGEPKRVQLGGRTAIQVEGKSGTTRMIAIMALVPEHGRRYLFMCTGDADACERDLVPAVTFR
jgi:hypothetical protein